MTRTLMLAALLASLSAAATAQPPGASESTVDMPKASKPNAADKDRDKSSSSTNIPTTGETSGRNNPSISTAPDNAPARGSARPLE
jgi:hypothetical protein